MIHILYSLLLAEMVLILLLLSSATRKLVVVAIELIISVQNFRVVLIAVLTYLLVLLVYNIYGIVEVQYRSSGFNPVDPVVQLIIAEKLLAASLIGFLLFLYLVICNLHMLIMDWFSIEEVTQAEQKQLARRNSIARERQKASKDEITALKSKIRNLVSILETKDMKIKSAETQVATLKQHSEEVNMKYDKLIEYNEAIRNQLQFMKEHNQEEEEEEVESVWPNLKTNITCGGLIQFPWKNQKFNTSITEVGPEIELQTTKRSSSTRHRQPIYTVDIH